MADYYDDQVSSCNMAGQHPLCSWCGTCIYVVKETQYFLQKTKIRTKRTLSFQVERVYLRCCSVYQDKSVLSKDIGLIGAWSTPWSTRLTLGRLWHHVRLRETRSWETLPVGLGLNQHQMSLRALLQQRQWSWHTEPKNLKLFLMFSEESPHG